jgi:hypothetical protein
VERITAASALFRPDGQLNDRMWAQQQITEALGELIGEAWSTVRSLRNEARTLNHLGWMYDQFEQAVTDPRLREAMVCLGSWRRHLGRAHGTRQDPAAQLVVVERLLCLRRSPTWPQAYTRVGHILTHTVHASRAVECMNRVLHMHQVRHCQVSQSMLDLKCLFWNCRTYTHGKRRAWLVAVAPAGSPYAESTILCRIVCHAIKSPRRFIRTASSSWGWETVRGAWTRGRPTTCIPRRSLSSCQRRTPGAVG